MNRNIWHRNFFENQNIKWPCPMCDETRLSLQKETLHKAYTAESNRESNHPEWEPEWVEGRFSCLFKCEACSEGIAVAGRYSIGQWGDHEGWEYNDLFEPVFFMKAPRIIHLPKKLPLDIQRELEKSFQLYWVDLASCANRIRSSVEILLTLLGVKRTSLRDGKRHTLSLHSRIEIFKRTNSSLAESLFAVKWIGNAGSHSNSLTDSDVLDGYEILEHVFAELFEGKTKELEKITRQINQSKKPRSARPNSRP